MWKKIKVEIWGEGHCYYLVAKSCLTFCDTMNCSMPGFPVLHCLPEFAQTFVHWIGNAIQPITSIIPLSSCPQSFPTSWSFPMSWLFASGGQNIGASASATVFPVTIQLDSLRIEGLIFLQSQRLSRVFSSTTIQKHQFFTAQPLWSNSRICTWLLEKPILTICILTIWTFVGKVMSLLFNMLSRFVIALSPRG